MKIQYKYKNELFDDIRDIVFNNKLEPDFDYILEEFIPFQIFITGRTFFKGVKIVSDTKYSIEEQEKDLPGSLTDRLIDIFSEQSVEMGKVQVASLSGGIDSSTVAAWFCPSTVYTGYYKNGEGYDETIYASAMADSIKARHLKIQLFEKDFLSSMNEVMDIYCTPAGGFGSVMEYAALKKVVRKMDVKSVLFGHGGDEIFMAYFYNRFVMNFHFFSELSIAGMMNFEPSVSSGVRKIVDFMIISLINRAGKDVMYSKFVQEKLEPFLFGIEDVRDKLLTININFTLPTLLHLNQQMCSGLGVKGYSPFTSGGLIKYAKALNAYPADVLPKQKLRDLSFGVPKEIVERKDKKGFPVPIGLWKDVRKIIEEEYNKFRLESWIPFSLPEFNGVDRYSWGVAQAGMYLNRFFKK